MAKNRPTKTNSLDNDYYDKTVINKGFNNATFTPLIINVGANVEVRQVLFLRFVRLVRLPTVVVMAFELYSVFNKVKGLMCSINSLNSKANRRGVIEIKVLTSRTLNFSDPTVLAKVRVDLRLMSLIKIAKLKSR